MYIVLSFEQQIKNTLWRKINSPSRTCIDFVVVWPSRVCGLSRRRTDQRLIVCTSFSIPYIQQCHGPSLYWCSLISRQSQLDQDSQKTGSFLRTYIYKMMILNIHILLFLVRKLLYTIHVSIYAFIIPLIKK